MKSPTAKNPHTTGIIPNYFKLHSLFPQVAVGHIVEGGAADADGFVLTGDEITEVDGVGVVGALHQRVVHLVEQASQRWGVDYFHFVIFILFLVILI